MNPECHTILSFFGRGSLRTPPPLAAALPAPIRVRRSVRRETIRSARAEETLTNPAGTGGDQTGSSGSGGAAGSASVVAGPGRIGGRW